MNKPKLNEKEQAAIKELQELARRWPRSLLIGGDGDENKRIAVWKQSEPGVHYIVGEIPCIKNMDSW